MVHMLQVITKPIQDAVSHFSVADFWPFSNFPFPVTVKWPPHPPIVTKQFNKNFHKKGWRPVFWFPEGPKLIWKRAILPTPQPTFQDLYRNIYNKLLRGLQKGSSTRNVNFGLTSVCSVKKSWDLIKSALNIEIQKKNSTVENILVEHCVISDPSIMAIIISTTFLRLFLCKL